VKRPSAAQAGDGFDDQILDGDTQQRTADAVRRRADHARPRHRRHA
jgi:hypothetical protein